MRCDAMRCDAMRCDAMRCDAMRCDAMRCDAMRCDAMRCDAMRCDAMRCDAMRYNTIQYNTIQYNTIQYNTIQYNTIQYNTIQYNTIQYNTIQYNTNWTVFVNVAMNSAQHAHTRMINTAVEIWKNAIYLFSILQIQSTFQCWILRYTKAYCLISNISNDTCAVCYSSCLLLAMPSSGDSTTGSEVAAILVAMPKCNTKWLPPRSQGHTHLIFAWSQFLVSLCMVHDFESTMV